MNLLANRTSIIVAAALFAAATFLNSSFDSRTAPTTLMLTSPQQTTAALIVGNSHVSLTRKQNEKPAYVDHSYPCVRCPLRRRPDVSIRNIYASNAPATLPDRDRNLPRVRPFLRALGTAIDSTLLVPRSLLAQRFLRVRGTTTIASSGSTKVASGPTIPPGPWDGIARFRVKKLGSDCN